MKVRGIAARRHDTPEYIRTMQRGMLEEMGKASTPAELGGREGRVREIYREAVERLPGAEPGEMLISRRISRLTYAHRCIEGAAVDAYRQERDRHRAGHEDPVRGAGRPEVYCRYGVGCGKI